MSAKWGYRNYSVRRRCAKYSAKNDKEPNPDNTRVEFHKLLEEDNIKIMVKRMEQHKEVGISVQSTQKYLSAQIRPAI